MITKCTFTKNETFIVAEVTVGSHKTRIFQRPVDTMVGASWKYRFFDGWADVGTHRQVLIEIAYQQTLAAEARELLKRVLPFIESRGGLRIGVCRDTIKTYLEDVS